MNEAIPVQTKATTAAESINTRERGGKLKKAASAVALAMMTTAGTAQAEPILFNFNCTLVSATTCTPGAQIASMTLSDSTVDRNRVDIDLVVSPEAGIRSLSKLYLNYGGPLWIQGRYFTLVRQDAPPWFHLSTAPNSVNLDALGPFGTRMDIALDLSNIQLEIFGMYTDALTLSTSLVNKLSLDGFEEGDLDAAAFRVKNPNNLIYAALEMAAASGTVYAGATLTYSPSDPDVLPIGNINLPPPPELLPPPDLTQASGALIQANIPEPGTLGLLGLAAACLGFASGFKKRRAHSCRIPASFVTRAER
jgi:hypothetical protein